MPEESTSQNESIDEEIRSKLRQIRSDYTRAQNILNNLEGYYASFDDIRKKLDDEGDGLSANLTWSQTKKNEIDTLVAQAASKVGELETTTVSIQSLVQQIQNQSNDFVALSAKLNDPNSGINAILTSATNISNTITTLASTSKQNTDSATAILSEIKTKSADIDKAYVEFKTLKKAIDDPETGIEAQFAEIKQYATDALKAKTSAETDLLAVTQFKENAAEHLESVKTSKDEVEGLKEESAKLTNDIRNTLGMTSAYSLSKAIEAQRKRLDRSTMWWSIAVGITLLLLAGALGVIFYLLFLDRSSSGFMGSVNSTGVLWTVLSKALFSSPFIFALYFTTSNYSRTRDFRDRYLAKEIAAKNLQAYAKLLREEFPDSKEERLNFALRNMQAIYDDPVMTQKKRSYNFGINKIFQLSIDEEDNAELKEKLVEDVEKASKPKKNIQT